MADGTGVQPVSMPSEPNDDKPAAPSDDPAKRRETPAGTDATAQSSAEPLGTEQPITEEQLASPDRVTMRLLSVICAVALLCWVGAKAGCNRRDVPVRQPAALTVEQARKTAKAAALEFAQAIASRRWEYARAFASSGVQVEVNAMQAACEKSEPSCPEKSGVFTRAVVLNGQGRIVLITTQSHGVDAVLNLEVETQRDADGWLVTKQQPPSSPPPEATAAPEADKKQPEKTDNSSGEGSNQ